MSSDGLFDLRTSFRFNTDLDLTLNLIPQDKYIPDEFIAPCICIEIVETHKPIEPEDSNSYEKKYHVWIKIRNLTCEWHIFHVIPNLIQVKIIFQSHKYSHIVKYFKI